MKKISIELQDKIILEYTTPNLDGTWNGCQGIAKNLNMNSTTIQNILKYNNIKLRNAREAHSNGKKCRPIINIPKEPPNRCKCGCNEFVKWNRRKNKYNTYVDGHYRKDYLYKNKEYLYVEYIVKQRTIKNIADDFGVCIQTVNRQCKKFGIEMRLPKESLKISGAVRGDKNPAWMGGIAKWDYCYNWKSLAREIRMRDKYICQSCGLTKKHWGVGLHVHHIDHDKTNNLPDNLISLCSTCHHEVHSGKRKL